MSHHHLHFFQNESIIIDDVFKNMKSEYLRLKHFETSNAYIRPESFHIGSQTVLDQISMPGVPRVKRKVDTGQKLSIKTKLKLFLELPNVYHEIESYIIQESNTNDSVLSSVIHGQLWKNIEKKYENKVFFPLLLFYDDFEPCNPLGSRAVAYKIGAVYITLSCMPPKYASSLENIFLAQLSYTSDREFYGNYKVFSNLIQDLKTLEVDGINVSIGDDTKRVYFPLLLIVGDNLGLNSVLGFSESFSADYFCRFCVTHRENTKVEVNSNNFISRTIENYNIHSNERSHGVKERCIWNNLENFHVTSNVYCDLMHDFLEGILRYDMAFLINALIKKRYFDLNRLNSRIKFFKFSKADVGNQMPFIKSEH